MDGLDVGTPIYGCHVTSREAMLFMKHEHLANVKVHLRTRRGNVNIEIWLNLYDIRARLYSKRGIDNISIIFFLLQICDNPKLLNITSYKKQYVG